MSPIASTSGCPGSVRSGSTSSRPTASVSAPDASASVPASPDASTPAAQMTVAALTRFSPPWVSIVTPSASIAVTRWSTSGVTPRLSSALRGLRRQLRRERGQDALARLDQQHARVRGVDAAEVAPRVARDLGDLSRHLDAGRPRAHDHERQLALTLGRVLGRLGGLERAQDLRADVQRALERLELRRVLLPLGVAEVVVLRAAADDQRVVAERLIAGGRAHRDRAGRQIEPRGLAQQHADALLAAEDRAQRVADLTRRQRRRSPPGRPAAGRGGSCGGRRG